MEDGELERVRPSTPEVVCALLRGLVGTAPGGALLAETMGLLATTANRMDRARQAAQVAADEVGGVEALVDLLHIDEQLEVLMLEALEVAVRTADARKRRLAGKVVGRAARDSAMIDVAHLFTRALRSLDAPHLHALAQIRALEMEHAGDEDRTIPEIRSQEGNLQERISRVMQEVAEYTRALPEPVRAVLLAEGVVREGNTYDDLKGLPALFTSHFGRQLLAELRAQLA